MAHWTATSAFRSNSLCHCCCKPTTHCNKSRDPVDLLDKLSLSHKICCKTMARLWLWFHLQFRLSYLLWLHLVSGINSLYLFVNFGTSFSISNSPVSSLITAFSSDSPLCSSMTPSRFHSRFKTYLFHKSNPCSIYCSSSIYHFFFLLVGFCHISLDEIYLSFCFLPCFVSFVA